MINNTGNMYFSLFKNRLIYKDSPDVKAPESTSTADKTNQDEILTLLREEKLKEALEKVERVYWSIVRKGNLSSPFRRYYPSDSPNLSPEAKKDKALSEHCERVNRVRQTLALLVKNRQQRPAIESEQKRIHDKLTRALRTRQATKTQILDRDESYKRLLEENQLTYGKELAKCIAAIADLPPSDLEVQKVP